MDNINKSNYIIFTICLINRSFVITKIWNLIIPYRFCWTTNLNVKLRQTFDISAQKTFDYDFFLHLDMHIYVQRICIAEYTDNMCREKRENKNIQVSFSRIPYMGQIENASLITYSTLLRKTNTLQYLIMDDATKVCNSYVCQQLQSCSCWRFL